MYFYEIFYIKNGITLVKNKQFYLLTLIKELFLINLEKKVTLGDKNATKFAVFW